MNPTMALRTAALVAALLVTAGVALFATQRARLPGAPAVEAGGAGAQAPTNFSTVGWDDLVPENWNPAQDFAGVDIDRLTDDDPRARGLLVRLREVWDQAPIVSTMDGRALRIAGYVVPLESNPDGTTEFLLVPHFGACIHTPPPPANQIIHVRASLPVKGLGTMDAVWISGTMHAARSTTNMGVSGYGMVLSGIEPYTRRSR
jgi:hypothetical protein